MTLLEQVMTLPLPQRRELCLKVLDSCIEEADRSIRPQFLIRAACEATGLESLPDTRDGKSVLVRFMVARQMLKEGYDEQAVGDALGRNRVTVWNMKRKMQYILDEPQYYKTEMQAWSKFQKAIHDETDNRTI